MSWRTQLQAASFRGIPFHTSRTDGEIGRRIQLIEYPLRDLPFAEDLGRKARTFSVDAFVLGADYMVARDRLIAALEAPGSGELVHPYRGRQNVVVMRASVEESSDQGGMARFSIEFAEAGENLSPSVRADTSARLMQAADNVVAASQNDFVTAWRAGKGSYDQALATAQSGFDWIDQHLGGLRGAEAMIDDLLNPLSSLVATPARLFARLVGSLERIRGKFEVPFAGASTFSTARLPDAASQTATSVRPLLLDAPAGRPAIRPVTSASQASIANRLAFGTATRTVTVVQVAAILPTVPIIASADLIAVRDTVFGAIDALADTASDETYPALRTLKVAALHAVNERLPVTSALAGLTPRMREPSLVLAWRQNGNIDAEADLVVRNNIRHPGFVPSGRPLQILKV